MPDVHSVTVLMDDISQLYFYCNTLGNVQNVLMDALCYEAVNSIFWHSGVCMWHMYSVRKKCGALPIEINAKMCCELFAFPAAVRHLIIIILHLAAELAVWQGSQLAFSCVSAL